METIPNQNDPTEIIESLRKFMVESTQRFATIGNLAVVSIPIVGTESAQYDIGRMESEILASSTTVAATFEYIKDTLGFVLTHPHPETGDPEEVIGIGYDPMQHNFFGIVGVHRLDPRAAHIVVKPELISHKPFDPSKVPNIPTPSPFGGLFNPAR